MGAAPASQDSPLPAGLATQVLPAYGHHSRVALGGSVGKLVWAGVIDREKFAALYAPRGGVTEELADLLAKRPLGPIVLTRQNAGLYVNVLWAIGLANVVRALDARGILPQQDGADCSA